MQKIKMLTAAWFGDAEVEISFPQSWEVHRCEMFGQNLSPMSDERIRMALSNPIGTETIRQMAKGRKEAVILFDDLTRPTPAHRIIPFILKELHAGGIGDDHIRFVAAIANHHTMVWHEFVKKLGEEIVERYRVYNHNPFHHLVDLGKTSFGTPVKVNREVMACDLKIALSGIIPHLAAGFGGGAKMILPGVCGIETVEHNHVKLGGRGSANHPSLGINKVEGNIIRMDMEEAARMAGLDVVLGVLQNGRREAVDLVVGDLIEAQKEGVRLGRKIYTTPVFRGADIVVTNTYPIENEPEKGDWAPKESLRDGGDAVYIWHTPEGRIPHYLVGRFGKDYGGSMWKPPKELRAPRAGRILVYGKHLSRRDMDWFGPPEKVLFFKEWEPLLKELRAAHGDKARVAAYPCTAYQCPPAEGED